MFLKRNKLFVSFLDWGILFTFSQRNHFYQFGEIRTITIVQRQQCAFIQFATRQAAETAAEKSFNKLIINGRRLNVKWGRLVSNRARKKLNFKQYRLCGGSSECCCVLFRSQAARGKEKDGVTESGIRLEPVPGLPGGMWRSPLRMSVFYIEI